MPEMKLDQGEINIKYVLIGLVAIVGYVSWFYNSVVIPLSNMQVQLTQIQVSIKASTQNFVALQTQVTLNSNDILILKEKVGMSQ